MILNVSGRTDIVAFYTPWFMKRIEEGYFCVRNPFNKHLVSRINLSDVDLILFCTKNPLPIVNQLHLINKPIIFHITITPYKKDIEPNVIDKKEIIEAVKKISTIIGIDNVYVRYDPVFISNQYNLEYHKKAFDKLCKSLNGYVKHIIISFIDDYKNVRKNYNVLQFKELDGNVYKEIGKSFSKSADSSNMTVQTCFEDRNLIEYGFIKNDCISSQLAYKMTGIKIKKTWKARKERKCQCVEMVDIGAYNTCSHFCKYCYANYDENIVNKNKMQHNPNSPLLIGEIESDDIIKIRK